MTRFTGADMTSMRRAAGPARRAARAIPGRRTLERVAGGLRRLAGSRVLRRLGRAIARLADAGTAGYPPDVKRRLKILNLIAYLIAVTTLIYAIQQALVDFKDYAPVVFINLALVVVACLVPFAHRIGDIAGGP